jgi:hypothetical protein
MVLYSSSAIEPGAGFTFLLRFSWQMPILVWPLLGDGFAWALLCRSGGINSTDAGI